MKPVSAKSPPGDVPVWLAAALVAVATAVAFGNSLHGPFVFDDVPVLAHGGSAREAGFTTAGRPLLALSFALNRMILGGGPEGYHVVNLAIHALAALALFGLVRRIFQALPSCPRPVGTALLVAVLWAVHPLQTESVTYIVQRAESLMGLLFLLAVYGFVRRVQGGGWVWGVVAVAACLSGAATKEVIVAAPLVCLGYDRAFGAGSLGRALAQRRWLYAGLFSSWLLVGGLLVANGGGRGDTAGFHAGVAWYHYAFRQGPAILHYLRLALVPYPLVFYYGRDLLVSEVRVVAGVALVGAALAATAVAWIRWPKAGLLPAAFFLILAPSSSVVPVATEIMAEHRMYLPLAAVVIGAVVLLSRWRPLQARVAAWSAGLFVAGCLGAATLARNQVYQNELRLWADAVAHDPGNPDARYNLGSLLLERCDEAGAFMQLEEAVRLQPDYALAYGNLAVACERLGKTQEAVSAYETALRLKPDVVPTQNNYANYLLNHGDAVRAIAHYRAALAWQPGAALTRCNLGLALTQTGEVPAAIQELETAVRLDPSLAQASFNLGNAYAAAGRNAEAAKAYEAALALSPDWPAAQNNLAVVKARGNL